MTVEELIEELQGKPLTYEVWTRDADENNVSPTVEAYTDHDSQRVTIW